MKTILSVVIFTVLISFGCNQQQKQTEQKKTESKTDTKFPTTTPIPQHKNLLINNVRIFNGKDEQTMTGNVLVIKNMIVNVSADPISLADSLKAEVIDGKGKFLMPGLIDDHVHLAMSTIPMTMLRDTTVTIEILKEMTVKEGREVLLRGFTTVRDMGGPVFEAKNQFDKGIDPGPRVFPSGAMVSQTSGHGDFRLPEEKSRLYGGKVSRGEYYGFGYIADGVPEVLTAVRENLREGATQIKLAAGGGSSTIYDPLDVAQYTLDELRAAVESTEDWGTYVTVHAYTPRAVRKSIEAGVKCIEHGNLLDEATVKLVAEKEIWICTMVLDDPTPDLPKSYAEKRAVVVSGTDSMMIWAKKNNVKLAWGTDHLFDPQKTKQQNSEIMKLKRWYSNFEILKIITYTNAQLLYLSGLRNPYLEGKLGEISEGAYGDMILVDGDPLENIDVLKDYEKNFLIIVKDGIVYKNVLK